MAFTENDFVRCLNQLRFVPFHFAMGVVLLAAVNSDSLLIASDNADAATQQDTVRRQQARSRQQVGTDRNTCAEDTTHVRTNGTDLKRALKAFRKRLKITVLDAESSIGGGPMSSGRQSAIIAITPPERYPRSVWDELVRQDRLLDAKAGMYELPPE